MRTTAIIISTAALVFALGQATANAASKARTQASIACSKEADTKGLHGKARKKFRETCKRGFGKSAYGKSGYGKSSYGKSGSSKSGYGYR